MSNNVKYYSANGIDESIEPLLPEFGYGCEIGASDGITGSNCKRFEDKGWLILCIEANPLLAEIGRSNRKLWRQVACGSLYSEREQFTIVGPYPYSSFSGFHADPTEIKRIFNCSDLGQTQTVDVSVETLEEVLNNSGFPRLDLLAIDVEGHEADILDGIDLNNWKPKIIVVECWESYMSLEITRILEPYGYALEMVKEYDYVYSRKES